VERRICRKLMCACGERLGALVGLAATFCTRPVAALQPAVEHRICQDPYALMTSGSARWSASPQGFPPSRS